MCHHTQKTDKYLIDNISAIEPRRIGLCRVNIVGKGFLRQLDSFCEISKCFRPCFSLTSDTCFFVVGDEPIVFSLNCDG